VLELAEGLLPQLDRWLVTVVQPVGRLRAKLVHCHVRRDREDPGAQVPAVLQPSIRAQGAQERLLPGVLGPLPEQPTKVPEHLVAVSDVETLERRNRRVRHHPHHGRNVGGSRIVRCAVVGHVEWVEFARVPHMPQAGEIVHAEQVWEEPAGGGAVVARQLALLAGGCTFFTALGDDALGHAASARLQELNLDLHVQWTASSRTRRAWTHVDGGGERTITVLGEKLLPAGPFPIEGYDLVFFVSGDAEALRSGRAARVLAATLRELPTLRRADVPIDLLVGSLSDPGEQHDGSLEVATLVLTDGARGGTANGVPYDAVVAPTVVDTYGAGDSFAAALAYGLARGRDLDDALGLAARAGAAVVAGAGPYSGQISG